MGQFLEIAAEKTRGLNWTSANIASHSGVDKLTLEIFLLSIKKIHLMEFTQNILLNMYTNIKGLIILKNAIEF